MLDDLLDAPFVGTRGRAELGLVCVEASEGVGEVAQEMLEVGVHGQDYLTRPAGVRLVPCGCLF
jgi:hypothetical protein